MDQVGGGAPEALEHRGERKGHGSCGLLAIHVPVVAGAPPTLRRRTAVGSRRRPGGGDRGEAGDGIVDTALGHGLALVVLAEAGGAPVAGVEHGRDQGGVVVEAAEGAADEVEQLGLGAERPVTRAEERVLPVPERGGEVFLGGEVPVDRALLAPGGVRHEGERGLVAALEDDADGFQDALGRGCRLRLAKWRVVGGRRLHVSDIDMNTGNLSRAAMVSAVSTHCVVGANATPARAEARPDSRPGRRSRVVEHVGRDRQ